MRTSGQPFRFKRFRKSRRLIGHRESHVLFPSVAARRVATLRPINASFSRQNCAERVLCVSVTDSRHLSVAWLVINPAISAPVVARAYGRCLSFCRRLNLRNKLIRVPARKSRKAGGEDVIGCDNAELTARLLNVLFPPPAFYAGVDYNFALGEGSCVAV